MNIQKTITQNGANGIANRTRDLEALRLMGKAALNGNETMFETTGRETLFYGVSVADRYFWEGVYGILSLDDSGHPEMEIRVGSHLENVPKVGRYMMPGVLYSFAPSTKAVLVSERIDRYKGAEIIQMQEELPK